MDINIMHVSNQTYSVVFKISPNGATTTNISAMKHIVLIIEEIIII